MIEAFGNIWDHIDEYDAVVITTNGFVKKNGEAVMGRGIALEAKKRWPWLPRILGSDLKYHGNQVLSYMNEYDPKPIIVTFPVKPEYGPNGEMGWKAKAQLPLIQKSLKELIALTDEELWEKVIMPRPGCGNGGLSWEKVKPIIEPYLDDRFTVMEKL